jgi:arabinofuranan 3-O-arabinosyltransferase
MLPQGYAQRLLTIISLALALSYAAFLAGCIVKGYWLIDQQGRGIGNDFVHLWATGRLVLEGHPAGAYDADLQRQAQSIAIGRPFDGDEYWPYPPTFLFGAALIASIPFMPASATWFVVTATGYVAAIRGILGGRLGVLFACGFPGALWTIMAGQNGFLSAGLIAGSLGLMERHPVFAGCCLGLLTYKPQFGLLFPLVLAVGGRWRVIVAATAVALILAGASWLAFGAGTWGAFAHSLTTVSQRTLSQGLSGWNSLQTIFAFVRALGGGETLAWVIQGVVALGIAIALCALWRSGVPFELKAGALAVGGLLATPYLFFYDLVLLAVPTAFFLRFAMSNGFRRSECVLLLISGALILSYPLMTTQVGLAAILIIAFLIGHRAMLCVKSGAVT